MESVDGADILYYHFRKSTSQGPGEIWAKVMYLFSFVSASKHPRRTEAQGQLSRFPFLHLVFIGAELTFVFRTPMLGTVISTTGRAGQLLCLTARDLKSKSSTSHAGADHCEYKCEEMVS